jgi:glutamine amidotransferase PdxT
MTQKPQIFIYWGPGTYLGGRNDVVVMFQKNYYEYHQWITFQYLDDTIKSGDVLLFPGGQADECMEYLKIKNNMTAQQVTDKIKSYISQGVHYLGICAGAYLASNPYEGFEYFGIFDYNGDRNGSGNTGKVDLDIVNNLSIVNGGKDVLFNEGPIFYLNIPNDFETLATFMRTPQNGFNGPNGDKFIGTPAILHKKGINQGNILLLTIHYEKGNTSKTAYKQFFKIFDNCIPLKA